MRACVIALSAAALLASGAARSAEGPIKVDGRTIFVRCTGHGSPTIVLDAGLGDGAAAWGMIQPSIARISRVCAYDRPGEGASDPPSGPQTVADQARTLELLLRATHWPTPAVLVGHSWGGAVAQAFAEQHLGQVAGMVMIDPSVPDQLRKWLQLLPPKPKHGPDPSGPLRSELSQALRSTQTSERLRWGASDPELRRLTSLGKTPLVVLTAGMLGLPFPTQALQARAYATWLALHRRLASLSSNSIHAVAQFSGHHIYESQPDLVVAAIRAVVLAARTHSHLPACRAVFRGHGGVGCI